MGVTVILAENTGRAFTIAGARWLHLLVGITWIGLLYYFNFVQTPSFAQFEAGPRTEAVRKLVPRALWWFRWAALMTFLTGIVILGSQATNAQHKSQLTGAYFSTLPGMTIFAGALMATIMMLNVWGVIWPNQKILIANAENVAAGGEADPRVPDATRKGAIASRTNTLFSIPVMWFMIGTSHFVGNWDDLTSPSSGKKWAWYIIVLGVTAIIEANALGLIGGTNGPATKPLNDHRHTIIAGFSLWAVYVVLMIILFT